MPHTPCTPNTSRLSSAPSRRLRPWTPHRPATPLIRPITRPPPTPTRPAAGVITTRPETAPEAAPSREGRPFITHSASVHDRAAAAGATQVLIKASAATPLASSAEPALKPNQPNQSREAPIMVMVRLWGVMGSRP